MVDRHLRMSRQRECSVGAAKSINDIESGDNSANGIGAVGCSTVRKDDAEVNVLYDRLQGKKARR